MKRAGRVKFLDLLNYSFECWSGRKSTFAMVGYTMYGTGRKWLWDTLSLQSH